jgi:hypothetical protein
MGNGAEFSGVALSESGGGAGLHGGFVHRLTQRFRSGHRLNFQKVLLLVEGEYFLLLTVQ